MADRRAGLLPGRDAQPLHPHPRARGRGPASRRPGPHGRRRGAWEPAGFGAGRLTPVPQPPGAGQWGPGPSDPGPGPMPRGKRPMVPGPPTGDSLNVCAGADPLRTRVVGRLGASPWAEPRVVVSGNFATPRHLLALFDGAVQSYRLFALNAQMGFPDRDGVIPESPFVGPGMRDLATLDYLPMRLSLVPALFEAARPPDVVLLHTSPPRHGRVSLGIEVNILPAAIERARGRGGLVVAQVNRNMPYTFGDAEIDCRPHRPRHRGGRGAARPGPPCARRHHDGHRRERGVPGGRRSDPAARHRGASGLRARVPRGQAGVGRVVGGDQ